jgi:hypothetical protein
MHRGYSPSVLLPGYGPVEALPQRKHSGPLVSVLGHGGFVQAAVTFLLRWQGLRAGGLPAGEDGRCVRVCS